MAKNTEISLRNKVIYSVYVRNHTNDGHLMPLQTTLTE